MPGSGCRQVAVSLGLCLFLLVPVWGHCDTNKCTCTFISTSREVKEARCDFAWKKEDFSFSKFPDYVVRITLENARQLKVGEADLSRLIHLKSVTIRKSGTVMIAKMAFSKMTNHSSMVHFEFADIETLVLEKSTFQARFKPISVEISRVETAIIQGEAFSSDLVRLSIQNVSKQLTLNEMAFYLPSVEVKKNLQITLNNIQAGSLCKGVFKCQRASIHIANSFIKEIKSETFNALEYTSLVIENTTIQRIESNSFPEGTYFYHSVELHGVTIDNISPKAVSSGLNRLVIDHSRIEKVETDAINIAVASVVMESNTFTRVFKRGFFFSFCDSILVSNNTFKKLDSEAFSSYKEVTLNATKLTFESNSFFQFESGAFKMNYTNRTASAIMNNRFNFNCDCEDGLRVESLVTDEEGRGLVSDGFCYVDSRLSQCFNIPQGPTLISEYWESICNSSKECEESLNDAEYPTTPSNENESLIRKRIRPPPLVVAFMVIFLVIMGGFFMLLIRCSGYCAKARIMLLPSNTSLSALIARLFSARTTTPTVSTPSLSRMSIHEYAELQRKVGDGLRTEVTILKMDDGVSEDKATQTMPEELTQELMKSLKEKLDDPTNHQEAREMIEHLYDLIKVEETTQPKRTVSQLNFEDEGNHGESNVYEPIIPRSKSGPGGLMRDASTATVPMPSVQKGRGMFPTLVSEYSEPRDRRVHIYTELPLQSNVICDYGEPRDTAVHLYTEVPPQQRMFNLANRPLPSKPDQPSNST